MDFSPKVQAILFDFDGTLRHSRPSYSQALIEIATSLGVPETKEGRLRSQRWLHYYWAQSSELVEDRESYNGWTDSFWTNHAHSWLLAYGCSSGQAAELAPAIYQRMADEYKPQDWVAPDVTETLDCLQDIGYRLAVVSNRNQPCHEELSRLGLSGYLEFSLTSGEVNSWKPDTRIFEHALQRLDLLPEEAVHIGDNYYADVVGALRAGIQPVLIDPEDLFPDVDCPVITAIGDLCGLLNP
ncbi:MAG: HAD family hydrolase [Anaerolineales bacterium]